MQSAISTISPFALQHQFEQGDQVLLIDVRTPAEFADGHAVGAVCEPLDGLDAQRLIDRFGRGAGTEQTLTLICASGRRAEEAAVKLAEQGLNNLQILHGGTQAWQAHKLPISRQTDRLSLERQTQIALGVLLLVMLAKGTLLHPVFLALIGLVAVGLIVAGATARCGLTALVARMPWNRQEACQPSSA